MTALVILPGLDGTATLHAQFIAALDASVAPVTVLRYPPDQLLDHAALERLVREALPGNTPFVLLGESFSGPIALSIAADPPANLLGLVLSTTFARAPIPFLSRFATLARIAPVRVVPLSLLSWMLLGRWRNRSLDAALTQALRTVTPAVLRYRAAAAMRVDVSRRMAGITLPVLYLRARGDRLITAAAGEHISAVMTHATLVELDGPHLLLQACPVAAANAVNAFVAQLPLAALQPAPAVCSDLGQERT